MTLYGIGLGPGETGLVTVRGKEILESADVVYSPGRLSRSVATEYADEERIGDLDFPMTRDEEKLRDAWKAAAAEIAPRAREETAAFVTLGDPNIYSTFGHLRRTLTAFHPEVSVEVVPGVSAVTAFTTALGIEVAAGGSLALREAAGGHSPTGPDRMVLFKVTDVPATHEGLLEADYDVVYGRRLYMEQGETVVTDDPDQLDERDYYTLAYAERPGAREEQATDAFTAQEQVSTDGGRTPPVEAPPVGDVDRPAPALETDSRDDTANSETTLERSEGALCGDDPEVYDD